MKQFFGAFFGSIVGIIIATVLAIVIIIAAVKSSFSSAFKEKEETSMAKPNSIIKLVLDGDIQEREKENPFKELGDLGSFGGGEELGLNMLVKKIDDAKKDKNVKGLYIVVKNIKAGFATVQELRNALLDFKKSGKFIYTYSENYSQKEYFLATASSKVFLNPQGGMDWRGLGMTLLFFKHTFEKLDLEMQVFRHGKFKSAVEPFMLDKMSQSNRYQSEIFLNSIWNTMVSSIAKERKMDPAELNRMADNLEIRFPEDAVGKLIDAASYEDEVISELKKKVGMKESDKLKFVDFAKYEEKKTELKLKADKIAVIYANGSISSGEGNDEEIGSDRLAKAIKEARMDEKIKAIVLRVNSPGGSALASDVIWREVLLAKKAKPVVVSMGDLAASGGYYISCAADHIFAQPNTITGSIGVFGLIPNMQKMFERKFGITADTVNTNKYSDLGSGLRPITMKEFEFIQNSVEKVYDTFTKRVAEGRKMSQAEVDSIGQGRVWSGSDALNIHLVDELGGLNEAIAYAVKKAKVKDYKLIELPKQKNPFDELLGKKESEFETKIIKRNLGSVYMYFKQIQSIMNLEGVQARLPFEMILK
jgi:protease-4